MPSELEFEPIASWPVALMVAVVPAESVPAAAHWQQQWKVGDGLARGYVKTNVLPVDASLTVVTEPAVSG
jgi:hypothetical protein